MQQSFYCGQGDLFISFINFLTIQSFQNVKKVKATILSLMLIAGTLVIPTESFSKDDQIIQGNCCAFPGQMCAYGGPPVIDYLYSNGPDCPGSFHY